MILFLPTAVVILINIISKNLNMYNLDSNKLSSFLQECTVKKKYKLCVLFSLAIQIIDIPDSYLLQASSLCCFYSSLSSGPFSSHLHCPFFPFRIIGVVEDLFSFSEISPLPIDRNSESQSTKRSVIRWLLLSCL